MDKKTKVEIGKFAGIDRFDRGTNTPPNFANELKNIHPVSMGELQGIKGYKTLNQGTALAGVSKIIHTAVHKEIGGKEKLLLFFKPDVTASTDFGLSLITSDLFTGVGGVSSTRNYYVVLYGAGGCYKTKEIFGVTLDSGSGTIFTLPDGLPAFVCQINIYQIGTVVTGTGRPDNAALVCAINRRADGTFPGWAGFYHPTRRTTASTALNQITPDHMAVEIFSGAGSLESDRIYYLAIAPEMAPAYNMGFDVTYPRGSFTSFDGTNHKTMSFLMPSGKHYAGVSFYYANTLSFISTSYDLTAAGNEVYGAWGFLGTTPEDMLLCGKGYFSQDGVSTVSSRFPISVTGTGKSFNATGLIGGINNFDEGSPVLYFNSGAGAPVGGLTSGTKYWVTRSGSSGCYLSSNYANYVAGVYISLSAPGTPSQNTFNQIKFSFGFDTLAYNSNNGLTVVDSYTTKPRELGGTNQQGDSNRRDGVFINSQLYPNLGISDPFTFLNYQTGADYFQYPLTGAAENIGCWVFSYDDDGNEQYYQLMANINEKNFSIKNDTALIQYYPQVSVLTSPDISPSLLWSPDDDILSTDQFTIRTYIANGINTLFQTNGYNLKPLIRSNGKARVPTSKYVKAFGNRLVCGGGRDSFQNSANQVYYSGPDLPFDWGVSIQTLNAFSEQGINGFGAYSQNLTTSGFAQYLLISKKDALFSWDGNTANGLQQLYYSFGMASSLSFLETDQGPVIVARDNVYTLSENNLMEIGDNISDILLGMSDAQLDKIVAVYHNKIIKIAYPSTAISTSADKEIWLDQRIEKGQKMRIYSGPHDIKTMNHQCAATIFGTDRDLRFSAIGATFQLRDFGYVLTEGEVNSPIVRTIVIDRMGLQEDYLWKVITDIYVATSLGQNTDITITLDFEDGTAPYMGTLSMLLANTNQLGQHLIRGRPRGRISKLTLSMSNTTAISIFNIGLLYEIQKRKLLRYT